MSSIGALRLVHNVSRGRLMMLAKVFPRPCNTKACVFRAPTVRSTVPKPVQAPVATHRAPAHAPTSAHASAALASPSNPGRARRVLVLPQARQQLAEALLLGAGGAAARALAAQVDELGDALPAGAAAARVLARGQEGVGLAPRLRDRLVLLVVVVLVEVVDGRLRRLDRLGLLGGRGVGAVLQREVPALAPLPGSRTVLVSMSSGEEEEKEEGGVLDNFGLLFRLGVGAVGGRGLGGAGDAASRSDLLLSISPRRLAVGSRGGGGGGGGACVIGGVDGREGALEGRRLAVRLVAAQQVALAVAVLDGRGAIARLRELVGIVAQRRALAGQEVLAGGVAALVAGLGLDFGVACGVRSANAGAVGRQSTWALGRERYLRRSPRWWGIGRPWSRVANAQQWNVDWQWSGEKLGLA